MLGTTVSHYRIDGRIGSGGMGVVYRAQDTRLGRAVALKFLPESVFQSEAARERFRREARAASALNHPHICTIHDIGEHEGQPFLVMELLEGVTLKQVIATRRLSVPQVLDLGAQVADALDAAHRRGIVHRDVKPSNVFVTSGGQAKVLDFGLAKMTADRAAAASGQGSDDRTVTVDDALTSPGLAVGTLAYMSPEQALGDEVDQRTDLFSLGLVIYEMATGRPAFTGTTTAIARTLVHGRPMPPLEIDPTLPRELAQMLDKALEKDRDLRYQSASDLGADLKRLRRDSRLHSAEHASQALEGSRSAAASTPARPARRWLTALTAIAVLAGVAALSTFAYRRSVTAVVGVGARAPTHLSIAVSPAKLTLANAGLAISPDGRTVVVAAGPLDASSWMLYARGLAEDELRPLRGTEGARSPFFSYDGQQVGFWKDYQLFRVRVDGGTPVPICRAQDLFGAAWARDDRIVFGGGWSTPGIWAVSAAGGTPQLLVEPPADRTTWYNHPDLLPDGRGVLFSSYAGGRVSVQAWSPSGGARPLVEGATRAQYVAPDLVVYEADGEIRSVHFDLDRLVVDGTPRVALQGIRSEVYYPLWAVATTGVIVHEPSYVGLKRLVWRTRTGATTPLPFKERAYTGVVLSPDGERVGVGVQDGVRRGTWGGAIDHEPLAPLTDGVDEVFLAFSPDAKWIAFTRHAEGHYNIFRVRADGSGTVEQLGIGKEPQGGPEFSRDGKRLLLNVENGPGELHVWEQSLDPPGPMRPLIKTSSVQFEMNARFSPDGRWLAYMSNATGEDQVWVQEYPKGRRLQVSTDGGMFPRWNPKGGEIFYRGATALMAVKFADGRAGTPEPLPFPGGPLLLNGFDVSPDGQRFLMLDSVESLAEPSLIHVVFDWAAGSTVPGLGTVRRQ